MAGSEHGPRETSSAAGGGPPPPRPTWVKILGILLVLIVVAALVMALAGSDHGPGRHQFGGGDPVSHTPPVQRNS